MSQSLTQFGQSESPGRVGAASKSEGIKFTNFYLFIGYFVLREKHIQIRSSNVKIFGQKRLYMGNVYIRCLFNGRFNDYWTRQAPARVGFQKKWLRRETV